MPLPFLAPLAGFLAEAGTTAAVAIGSSPVGAAIGPGTAGKILGGAALGAGTVGLAGASAVGQGISAHKAAQAQQAAAEVSRDKAKISAGRERRRIVREAQAQRAGVVSQAVSQGVEAGSTARIGAVQDIGTQESRNLGFVAQQADLGRRGGAFLDKAATFTQRANLFKVGVGISNQFLQEIQRG